MAESAESDHANGRHWSMWAECGMQFRSNLVDVGGTIPLHAHSYDHVSIVTHGVFRCTTTAPDGMVESFIAASKDMMDPESRGYRFVIPAGWQHTFELLRSNGQPGEVLCFWPEGWDQE